MDKARALLQIVAASNIALVLAGCHPAKPQTIQLYCPRVVIEQSAPTRSVARLSETKKSSIKAQLHSIGKDLHKAQDALTGPNELQGKENDMAGNRR